MTSSSSFLILAAASSLLLLGVLAASIVVGTVRRKAGHQLSDEIEQAAGMQGRWNQRPRTGTGTTADNLAEERPKVKAEAKGGHAAA